MEGLHKHNRREKREPKYGLQWCWTCDQFKILEGQKCKVCGRRAGIKRFKKPSVPAYAE